MDPAAFAGLKPASIREHLAAFVCRAIDAEPARVAQMQARVQQVIDAATHPEIAAMQAAFAVAGQAYEIYRADPLARRIHHVHMRDLAAGSRVQGLENLAQVRGRPQVWICNHLSYVDTQVLDGLLARESVAVAGDLLVVAGPKVYADSYRRFASIGLNTLKTPQSTSVASKGTKLNLRELAKIAIETQGLASIWRDQRGPLLIYPEGARSLDGRLQPFLRGVHRWLRKPADLVVVPVGHSGAERLFARDERMRPQSVQLRFGTPFSVGDLARQGRHGALEEAWHRVAELLPPGNSPELGTQPVR
jgi:1-acyl-sn-glycerol-3-phosphate acyltransferase